MKIFIRTLFVSVLVIFVTFNVQAQKVSLQRIDPPSWWVGMHDPNLQLMVFGHGISKTQPVIDYPGVSLEEVIHVTSPDYLFLNLIIGPGTKPGIMKIHFREGKTDKAVYAYALNKRNLNPKLHQGFNDSDVIYLIMSDRFSNGDPSNDNMPGMLDKANLKNPNGRHGGDIQGIINHLKYIKDLGATAIWPTPLLEDNMPHGSYHGYAMTDYYKVDPRFGTNRLYKKMVEDAHKMGLKVIQDMVFNHCGTNYFWKNDLPTPDWYNQWPTFTRSNYHGVVVSDPHASKYDYRHMVAGWFDKSMADLNQNNPLVANYLIQNTIWWIEYTGLDGIRQDTYPYAYKKFSAHWMERILEEYPHFSVVGETWFNQPATVAYWLQNKKNYDGYQSHLTNAMDFPLCFAVRQAFNEPNGWTGGLARLYDVLAQDFVYSNPKKLLVFADNHDMTRLFTALHENLNSWKMAMAFLMTTRGIPEIYYGDEILLKGDKAMGDGVTRKDFPGGWPGDPHNAFTAQGRTPEQNIAFNFLKRLLNWRQTNKAVRFGKLTQYIVEDGIYVYFRSYQGQKVMVMLNNNKKPMTVDMSRYADDLKGFTKGKSVMTSQVFNQLKTITIPARSPLIVELEK